MLVGFACKEIDFRGFINVSHLNSVDNACAEQIHPGIDFIADEIFWLLDEILDLSLFIVKHHPIFRRVLHFC